MFFVTRLATAFGRISRSNMSCRFTHRKLDEQLALFARQAAIALADISIDRPALPLAVSTSPDSQTPLPGRRICHPPELAQLSVAATPESRSSVFFVISNRASPCEDGVSTEVGQVHILLSLRLQTVTGLTRPVKCTDSNRSIRTNIVYPSSLSILDGSKPNGGDTRTDFSSFRPMALTCDKNIAKCESLFHYAAKISYV